ncbi:Hypothetical predicted protein [Pelobates cultripes]|uniref:Uncharacterized protein n=1 Tax=Pelobates cultripes TaxID=61616 RepID=A0AAD1WG66_PELCU|nr:Hypothetical predicted protein [Pelobates cultripes]
MHLNGDEEDNAGLYPHNPCLTAKTMSDALKGGQTYAKLCYRRIIAQQVLKHVLRRPRGPVPDDGYGWRNNTGSLLHSGGVPIHDLMDFSIDVTVRCQPTTGID